MWRRSKGIALPEVFECAESDAMSLVSESTLTYEKTIEILEESGAKLNLINSRQYNSKAEPLASSDM